MSTPRRPSPRRSRSPLAATLLLLAALSGCGGGGGAPNVGTGPQSKRLDTTAIRLAGGAKAVWGNPSAGGKPKALLVMIHGGSWKGIDPAAFQSMVATAGVFQNLGFETLTVDYRQGALGITDVNTLYQDARRRVGASFPVCAVGVSAGGHIALELAVRNPDLSCVIDLAGPTNLPGLNQDPNGAAGYQIALKAFGKSQLAPLSPALHAQSIKAKLLLIYAATDHLVPVQQGRDMARADPQAKLIVLPPGPAPFVHTGIGAPAQASGVDATANQQAQMTEVSFLDAVAGSR